MFLSVQKQYRVLIIVSIIIFLKLTSTRILSKQGQKRTVKSGRTNHHKHFIFPLQLTKWGNKKWTLNDVLKMRRKLVGSHLTSPPSFDAEVDAISSATITSAVIFDSFGQGKSLLQELSEKGYLKD